ncbi:hypothetical protein CYMTET_17303, partial [Cymbomonas tetramitiformis]
LEALGEDTELVLAEAGVPGGPGRAAMLAAYQALSELGSGQAGRGPGGRVVPGLRAQRGLREAAWMGSLVRLLAESGHSLEEAFHLAWEQVHVQGEGGQEAKDLVEACLPLGRLHEDLCVPSAWPYASSVSGGSGWGGYIAGGLAYTEWPLLRTVGAALATELRVALEGVSELEIFCGASPLVLAGLSGGRLQESLSGGLASAASMAVDSEGGAGLAQGGTPRDAAAALWLCRVRAAAACATERGAGAGAGSLRALAHWLGQVAARVHVGALPGPAATLTVDRVAAELRMTAEVVTQLVGHPVVARLQTAMVRLAAAAELPPCLHELQAGSLLQAAGAVAAEAVAQAAASSETEMGTAGHTRRGVGAAGAIAPLLGGGHVSGVWFGSAAEEWHEVVGASGVLTALRAALYSANQQNAVYADSAAAVAAGTESAVQLSIWRREHSLERARKPPAHPCVDPLHPLFVAVAAFEAQMLDACAPRAWVPSDVEHALGTEGCVGVTMRQLQEGREELWAAAQSPAALPSLDALLVAWLHLRKAAAAALALAMPSAGQSGGGLTSGEGVQHTLDLACRAMDKAFNIPAGGLPDLVLWQHAGHPAIGGTPCMQAVERDVRVLCDILQVGAAQGCARGRSSIPSSLLAAWAKLEVSEGEEDMVALEGQRLEAVGLLADKAVRSALLQGLCLVRVQQRQQGGRDGTVAVPRRSNTKSSAAAFEQEAAEEEARVKEGAQIQALVVAKLTTCIAGMQREGAGVERAASGGPGEFSAAQLQFANAREMRRAVLPLCDLSSLAVQVPVLEATTRWLVLGIAAAEMAAAGVAVGHAAEGVNHGVALLPDVALRSTLQEGLALTGRSPADFAAHQQLLWWHEAGAGAAGGALDAAGLGAAAGLVQDLWLRWHRALWSSCLNPAPAVQEQGAAGAGHHMYGGAQLNIGLRTQLAGSLVKGDPGTAVVGLLPLRRTQLQLGTRLLGRAVADAGALAATHAAAHAERRAGASLAAQVLLAVRERLPVERRREFVTAVQLLLLGLEQGGAGGAVPPSTVDLDAAEVVVQAGGAKLCTLALGPIRGPTLAQGVLTPLLQELKSGTHEAAGDEPAESSAWMEWEAPGAAGLVRRGRVWALLGLLRMHLLLPPGCADPAAEAAETLAQVRDRLARDAEPHAAARAWEASAPGGAAHDGGAALRQADSACARLREQIEGLRGGLVSRPDPPRFRELSEDTQRFLSGVGKQERVLALVANLEACSAAAPAAGGSSGAAGASHARQEAALWQDNAMQWMEQIARSYPAYHDIVAPLQLAVYELKHGLSLLQCAMESYSAGAGGMQGAAAVATTGASVSPAADVARGLCALVAFPTPPQGAPAGLPRDLQYERLSAMPAPRSLAALLADPAWHRLLGCHRVKQRKGQQPPTAALERRLGLVRVALGHALLEVEEAGGAVVPLRSREDEGTWMGGAGAAFAAMQQVQMELCEVYEELRRQQRRKEQSESQARAWRCNPALQ